MTHEVLAPGTAGRPCWCGHPEAKHDDVGQCGVVSHKAQCSCIMFQPARTAPDQAIDIFGEAWEPAVRTRT